MASFTTTIELHDANEKDYGKLSTELKGELFKETRQYKKNGYLSRKVEYNVNGNVSLQDITGTVLKAIGKTGKQYSFTVVRNKSACN